jgi:hypothetical protein
VAFEAVRSPVTRPRLVTNQRFAIIAPSGTEIAPVAAAFTKPHRMSSCHGCVMNTDRPAPVEIPSTATAITRRMPNRSTNAAANGPPRP